MSSSHGRVRTLCVGLVFALAWHAFAEEAPAVAPEAPVAPEAAAPAAPVVPPTAEAIKAMPAWMQPEVIKSAVLIGMNEEQQTEFRRLVGNYITDRFSMIQQVVSRGGVDLERTIKSKDRRLQTELDKQMKVVLTKEQWPKYEDYKKVLKSKMKG